MSDANPHPPLTVVYRDEYLIAIDKPSGLLVHRTLLDRNETRFAVQLLRDQIGQHVHPVHRLDRGTSGVLLFALDREIGRRLGAQFEAQRVDKTYLAVVRGHPPESGRIDHALSRQYDDYEFRPPDRADGEAQPAATRYRRHQIRRHLKHIAHPIIGDATYGKGAHNRLFTELFGSRRMLLACLEMRLTHPASGAALPLRAPLGADFTGVADALGLHDAIPAAWRATEGSS